MADRLSRHVAWLDGWRGAAVLCVLVSHFGGPYFLGRFGVDAFFVLSGLLIAGMLLERRQPLPTFFWRRAARILPAFLAFLLVIHLVDAAAGFVVPPRELFAELVFVRNYWPTERSPWFDGTLPLEHLWSLNVEEQAYLWMALAAWWLRSRPFEATWFLLASAAACLGFDLFHRYQAADPVMPYTIRTECAAFPMLLSAGLSRLLALKGWWLSRRLGAYALALAVAFGTVGVARISLHLVVVPALLALALNALWSGESGQEGWLARAFAHPWLRALGRCSFSVYLWQQPLHNLYEHGRLPGAGVLWLALSVAIGAGMYALVERPARRWLVAHAPRRVHEPSVQR